MNVVEAPDILYNETSNDTIVAEGASVSLRCEARGFPEPTVEWQREGRRQIVIRSNKEGRRVERGKESFFHDLSISYLNILSQREHLNNSI